MVPAIHVFGLVRYLRHGCPAQDGNINKGFANGVGRTRARSRRENGISCPPPRADEGNIGERKCSARLRSDSHVERSSRGAFRDCSASRKSQATAPKFPRLIAYPAWLRVQNGINQTRWPQHGFEAPDFFERSPIHRLGENSTLRPWLSSYWVPPEVLSLQFGGETRRKAAWCRCAHPSHITYELFTGEISPPSPAGEAASVAMPKGASVRRWRGR
jgi:hypothetical protein